MPKWSKIAVAALLAVLLAAFGINNIGGDTWMSAGAPLPPGFQRDVHGAIHQRATFRLVPVILVIALAAGALLHAYLTRPKEEEPEGEEEPGEPPRGAGGNPTLRKPRRVGHPPSVSRW